jgi:hypothetical protein
MATKQATVKLSSFERFVHNRGELDYVITRLPFVMVVNDQCPRSYELHVKERTGERREQFEVLVSLDHSPPIAFDALRAVALHFYRANRLDLMSTKDVPGIPIRVTPRSYTVELS